MQRFLCLWNCYGFAMRTPRRTLVTQADVCSSAEIPADSKRAALERLKSAGGGSHTLRRLLH